MESKKICYCFASSEDSNMIQCMACKVYFHITCLKSGSPTILAGDVYFKFTCSECSETQQEIIERMKLPWTVVIILTIYNLQLQGSGKCGYFRWREDICRFVDRNWNVFFGADRKKALTWHHTVAGVLSSNCHKYFLSGAEQLGEKGWWTLKNPNLPTVQELETMQANNKSNKKGKLPLTLDPVPMLERTRQRNSMNILEAASALKAKRTTIDNSDIQRNTKKKRKMEESIELKITLSKDDHLQMEEPHILKTEVVENVAENVEIADTSLDFSIINVKNEPVDDDSERLHDSNYFTEQYEKEIETMKQWLKQEPSSNNMELDIDDSSATFDISRDALAAEPFDMMLDHILNDSEPENEQEIPKSETESVNKVMKAISSPTRKNQIPDAGRKRKVVVKDELPEERAESDSGGESRCRPMNLHEEQRLFSLLEEFKPAVEKNIEARNLYRKLAVRKLKRERNLPIFDFDEVLQKALNAETANNFSTFSSELSGRQEILDRYQIVQCSVKKPTFHRGSFFSRLMGLDDEQQESVISPYTTRILKPYIYRDFETEPPKLKLLREIVAYRHRRDADWIPPPVFPIDYCYVRAQHIPAVNALCQEFFWPGIDLSECLQYPDFSCVALYKKVVIGFAFMVPDVNINEAYITFIFTHPDWRRAGTAMFMLYHLIQTCMGKDITLHVSANSPAVFLYQKFGFKVEEFILDFYEKYLPADSKECRHALFMRLSR